VKEARIATPQLPPEDERALVAGCRAKDPGGLDRFFRLYVGYVERVIGRLVGPTADLQDLVQTTFIQALQSFDRFRGEASLKTWITRIAVHVALNQLRSGVRRHAPLELVRPSDEPIDPATGADVQMSTRQLARQLHELLDRMPPKKRIAFLLHTVEEHPVEEVAALTGASRAATKSRFWSARREITAAVQKRPELRAFLQTSLRGESWR